MAGHQYEGATKLSLEVLMVRGCLSFLGAVFLVLALVGSSIACDEVALQRLLKTKECQRCDLTGCDLSGAKLTWANLTGANLAGANLREVDLFFASLTGANLTEANLYLADMTVARLTEANFHGAELGYAKWYTGRTCKLNSPAGHCIEIIND
jgi:uncharacterized protein YjbI with pentapeptide repeats